MSKLARHRQQARYILVLMRGVAPVFQVAGSVSKYRFKCEHRAADAGHRLALGTWYMHEENLWPLGRTCCDDPVSNESVKQR
jgi:hypothetical protein